MAKTAFEKIMAYDTRNKDVFDEIVKFLKKDRLVPFVGAGLSASFFATWGKFFKEEYKNHMHGESMPENYLDAASKLLAGTGTADFYSDVRRAFGGNPDYDWAETLDAAKSEAVALLPELFPGLVVTTNFDLLLERVYGNRDVAYPGMDSALNRALTRQYPLLFKAHGTVTDVENIVFTRESYDKNYKPRGALVKALKGVFGASILLFLGCSLGQDKTLELWAKMNKPGVNHYAIINCSPDKKAEKRLELSEKRIRTILYNSKKGKDHTAVRTILEKLFEEVNGRPYGTSDSSSNDSSPPNNLRLRNEHFSGRDEVLKNIHSALNSGSTVALKQYINGLGGVGKTQTALEYAHRHADEYGDGICWLNAEDEPALLASCAEFSKAVGANLASDQSPEQTRAWLLGWLSAHKNWLLIFDNAESADLLGKYIPPASNGHILITTRNQGFDIGKSVPLSIFEPDEAVNFLLERTERESDPAAAEIAERLGYLPLALEQAAAYMRKSKASFESYLDILNTEGLAAMEAGIAAPADYANIVTTTWSIAFEKLSEAGQQVLNICAYMAADNIPLSVFAKQREQLPPELSRALETRSRTNELIAELLSYSLIERNSDDTINIHRLVQEVVRANLYQSGDKSFLDMCFLILFIMLPSEYGANREDYELFKAIAEHTLAAAEYYDTIYSDDNNKRELAGSAFHSVGRGYNKVALYDNAMAAYMKALSIREKVLSAEHPSTATTYNNIAGVYDSQGDYPKALEWLQKALAIYEKELGAEHSNTATTYNNIAGVYSRQGDYPKALEWLQKALAIREKVLGTEHLYTAAAYNGIAGVYSRQGAYPEALKLYMKALAIREKALGTEHPDTAVTYNHIAGVYDSQGDYPKALEWLQKDLAICERVLGTEHPNTAATYNNIAGVYSRQGDYPKALKLYQKALAICEKALGAEHPDTAYTYNGIAVVYSLQGNYPMALEWYAKSLAIREKVLGTEHPDTAYTYNGIAVVYSLQGDYSKALEWYMKALRIFEARLGMEHPYTLAAKSNIEALGL